MNRILKCTIFLLVFLMLFLPSFALAYDHVFVTKVGFVRVFSNSPGVSAFGREGNAAFPECTTGPTSMWTDSNYSTPEGRKASLAILLAAKGLNANVTVYFNVDTSGNCRFEVVDIN